jgi:hypothetical protein
MLHRAGKFIFDSGADADGDTTKAIKETAFAMLEDGRFHLPYPTTWIEDPFETDLTGEHRNYYLAYEKDSLIRVWAIFRPLHSAFTTFHFCTLPLIIDLDRPLFDGHQVPMDVPPGQSGHDPLVFAQIQKLLGEADYAFRKFIVTPGSGGIECEHVPTHHLRSGQSHYQDFGVANARSGYAYTIIRIPHEPVSTGEGSRRSGTRRRRHFVRGFVWGKNTGPREEQRWVAGYYRGSAKLGDVYRSHYEVRTG